MHRRSLATALCVVVLGVLLPLPLADALPALPEPALVGRAEAADRLDRTNSLLSTRGLGDAVRAGAALAGVQVRAGRVVGAPTALALPASIAEPVGELLAAVQSGEEEALASFEVPPLAFERLSRSEQLRSVDRSRLFSAGLSVAETIDRTLPRLQAVAAALPISGADAAGCDLVNQLPVLCIGNTGDNVYTQDVGLLIDLGGNDVYRNSAGGATAIGNQLAASVNIDLAGNDRYEAAQPLASGAASAQGSANYGIGILLDQAGDDFYTAVSTCNTCSTTTRAQGFAALGVGMLADFAGNDRYAISAEVTQKETAASAEGQGYGGLGLGLALDYGGGKDEHVMKTNSCWSCLSTTYGFGYGRVGGAGISYDDGGTDTFSLLARSEPVGPNDPDSVYQPYLSALAYGMGYGDDGGGGVQMSGPGDTQRVALAETISPHAGGTGALGFGYGDSSGSFGGLHDEGGNDGYLLASSSRAVDLQQVDDTCGCRGIRADAIANSTLTAGLGATALGGVAMLRDMSGNDSYVAEATSFSKARASDERTALVDDDQGAAAVSEAGQVHVEVQGVGIAGVGILEDLGGDDSYNSRATSEANASATALGDDARTEASALSQVAQSFGQGASLFGLGELRDEGGNDSYKSTNVSAAEAVPATSVTEGVATSFVQGIMLGGGPGNALLLDSGGSADTFTSTPPARAPCSGTRGGDMWMDCGLGAAIGLNR